MSITRRAPAKLNLSLDVTYGRREDGYHPLRSVMQTIDWYDTVTVDVAADTAIHLTCDGGIPANEHNTAYRAAALFRQAAGRPTQGYVVTVKKEIPAQAGMAGGSADAAAVLRALNTLTGEPLAPAQLHELATRIGADVPFCLYGGTALATGTGTEITPLPPLPPCALVVVKPEGGVSTAEAYRLLDSEEFLRMPDIEGQCQGLREGDLGKICRGMGNSFELPLSLPHTAPIIDRLLSGGALGASLTGSGSAVFGVFADLQKAANTATALAKTYPLTRLCQPVSG